MADKLADDLTGTPAAMPCVPLPPPEPALDFLLAELFKNIVEHIPGAQLRELFALRRTCRLFRLLVADFLRPDMDSKLRHIRVLMTKDGLTALLELMAVPSWRCCIQAIEFVDPGLGAMRQKRYCGDSNKFRWLGYYLDPSQLETVQKTIAPAQGVFWHEEASSLLTEVFNAFKTIQGLQEIHFRAKDKIDKPLLGLRHLLKDIGFCYVGSRMAQNAIRRCIDNREIDTYIPAEYTRFLHQALSDSSFNKRIVHLNIRNRTGTGRYSLAKVWVYTGHQSILNLNAQDKAHMPPPATTMTLSTMDMDTNIQGFAPATTSSIEKLQLVGCSSASSCAVDTKTFSILANTAFPNLGCITLNGYSVTSEQLMAFLRHVKSTLRSVHLNAMHLISGSWDSIFRELDEFELLDSHDLRRTNWNLSEMKKLADGSLEKFVQKGCHSGW